MKFKHGVKVQIDPTEYEGRIHKGKEFIIDGGQREICGIEVVTLNNTDGSRFSPAYDLSMLQVIDA